MNLCNLLTNYLVTYLSYSATDSVSFGSVALDTTIILLSLCLHLASYFGAWVCFHKIISNLVTVRNLDTNVGT